jgi:putative transposase
MTNHVHLVIDPGADPSNLAHLMKRVAGRQTRYVNRLAKRTGTLWDGRYKSSLIKVDEYLLACCRYVELNPVRAGMVVDPGQYRWSSYRHKIGLSTVDWLDRDPFYMSLGNDPREREASYRVLVESALARGLMDREWDTIREAVQRGQLTGGKSFIDEIQDKTGRRIEFRGPGRPSDQYRPE